MSNNKKDSHKGYLLKWTNYLRGYQKRWFVVSNGLLSYYRNQHEVSHTCRGTLNLAKANIKVHDSFYIVLSNEGNQTYHLKSLSEADTHQWVIALHNARKTANRLNDAVLDDSDTDNLGNNFGFGLELNLNSPNGSSNSLSTLTTPNNRKSLPVLTNAPITHSNNSPNMNQIVNSNLLDEQYNLFESSNFKREFDMKLYDLRNSFTLVQKHSDTMLGLLKDLGVELVSTAKPICNTLDKSVNLESVIDDTTAASHVNHSITTVQNQSKNNYSTKSSANNHTTINPSDDCTSSPHIPLTSINSVLELTKKIKDKNKSFTVYTQACVNSCSEFVNRVIQMQNQYQRQLTIEKEQRLRLERMVEELAKQLGTLEKKAVRQFETGTPGASIIGNNSGVMSSCNLGVNDDKDDDSGEDCFYDAIEDDHMFNVSLPRPMSPHDAAIEPQFILNEYESCSSSDSELENDQWKSNSIARVIVRSSRDSNKNNSPKKSVTTSSNPVSGDKKQQKKEKKESGSKKTHRRTASSGILGQSFLKKNSKSLHFATNSGSTNNQTVERPSSPNKDRKAIKSMHIPGDSSLDEESAVSSLSPHQSTDNPALIKENNDTTTRKSIQQAYTPQSATPLDKNNDDFKQLKSAQSVPHLPTTTTPTSANSSVVPIKKRVRRDRIPPRPNVSVNLWGIMKNCIGKELSKIPMPVNFNEPLSILQRLTEDLEYAECLDQAAACTDPIEQLAWVAAFTVSSYSTTTTRTGKPFNPLLGETFECDRRDDLGWRSLAEQVSHHPPAAALHAESERNGGWKCWQEFTMSSKFRGKYLAIIPLGKAHLTFNNSKNHYTWRKVNTTVHNIIVGKLWIDNHGEMDIYNHVTGDICHLNYKAYSYFSREPSRRVSGVITDKHGVTKYVLNGTWDEYFEGAKVLEIRRDRNNQQIFETAPTRTLWKRRYPPEYTTEMYNFTMLALQLNEMEDGVAPTDSRLRPDQRMMEVGQWDEANKVKERLEEKQREKRRRRERENEQRVKEGLPEVEVKPSWFTRKPDDTAIQGSSSIASNSSTSNTHIYAYNGGYWECKDAGKWSSDLPDIF